jgi:hypothetical protein
MGESREVGDEEGAMVDAMWFPSHLGVDFCFPQERKSIRDDEAAVGMSPSPDGKAMIDRQKARRNFYI